MSLDKFIPVAKQCADAAGAILRQAFGTTITALTKADNSPVTEADRMAEAAMRDILTRAFPDHGIIGEEMGAVNPNAEFQWVIDPIDGTRAFIAGYPTFTTLIALCKNGAPIFGLIDQPILQKRWISSYSPPIPHPSSFTLATTSFDYFTPQQHAAFTRLKDKAVNVIYGGDAYAYAMLAEGRISCVIDAAMKPYDYAALVPVIESRDGIITDWQGNPLTLASKGDVLACANRALHEEILRVISR